jgi:hypothetical protein
MRVTAIIMTALLVVLCVTEAIVIHQLRKPDPELLVYRESDRNRKEFCVFYRQVMAEYPYLLSDPKTWSPHEFPDVTYDVYTKRPFFELCDVERSLDSELVEIADCEMKDDWDCVARTARRIANAIPEPALPPPREIGDPPTNKYPPGSPHDATPKQTGR